MCLISLIITPLCIGQPQDCIQRNISCVEAPNGFIFRHECPPGSEFTIEAIDDNETVIATSHPFHHSTEILCMDNDSVTIQQCQALRVTCTLSAGEKHIKEKCLDFKMTTGKLESPDPIDPPKPWGYIGLGVVVIFVIAVGFGILCWRYKSWKSDVRRQQEVTTPSFSRYLLTCFGLGNGTFRTGRGETEISHPEEVGLQEVTHGELTTQQNGDTRDPRGSGEKEAGEENPLRNGHVHSIDLKADGKTPQSLGLDHNFWNETIQQTRNGDISVPKVNGESHHRALNRNPRDDDPGGANSNKRKDTIGKTASGWTVGDHNAEDHETEGLLPMNQRAAIQGFDMTGEATALVNKPGFDPDQVSGGSVAPETDVESAHNMKT